MTVRNPAPKRIFAFGSCQERKVFPSYFPPNRLGNHTTRQDAPHRGPGCYDNHKFGNMAREMERPGAPRPTVAFGSCQERKVFPVYFPPNRLGNHMTRQDTPHRGPGCYDNHKFCSMTHDLESRPISKRGYSARTGPRFLPPNKTVTPSPQMYQQDQAQSTMAAPTAKTPFHSNTFRFTNNTESINTNPGKVAWPMSFGTPDWSKIPQLKKRTLRAELNSDKDFKKQRANMAYLSLYYGNNNGLKRS